MNMMRQSPTSCAREIRLTTTDLPAKVSPTRVESRVGPKGSWPSTQIGKELSCAAGISAGHRTNRPKPKEYEVKADYLYNFGRFVRWPADIPAAQDNSFPICVLGQDPFGPTLDSTLIGER